MKAIQFTIDEALLEKVDQDPEVRERGRSAFLRNAITSYMKSRREQAVRQAYEQGYCEHPPSAEELGPWGEEQAWPVE